ncbi:MAG: response regulator [bacterium]|nr:response regulator [bacterium]
MEKVLIADDLFAVRRMIKGIFMSLDNSIKVIETDNADVAVDLYIAIKPDLAIMDIRVGNTDGIQACEKIMKHDKDARVLVVTSYNDEEMVRKCRQLGVKGIIVKPFTREYFLSVLSKINGSQSNGCYIQYS